MDKIEVEKLYQLLENSLVGYEVNGNPKQRKYFLYNIAVYMYRLKNKNKK